MSPTDLSFYAPHPAQLALALACVVIVQKLKLTERFPWLTEYTDSANLLASVLLAVVATALFDWRDFLTLDQADFVKLGKDAGIQWLCQQVIYRVGVKNALQTLFGMLGIGPKPPQQQSADPGAQQASKTLPLILILALCSVVAQAQMWNKPAGWQPLKVSYKMEVAPAGPVDVGQLGAEQDDLAAVFSSWGQHQAGLTITFVNGPKGFWRLFCWFGCVPYMDAPSNYLTWDFGRVKAWPDPPDGSASARWPGQPDGCNVVALTRSTNVIFAECQDHQSFQPALQPGAFRAFLASQTPAASAKVIP